MTPLTPDGKLKIEAAVAKALILTANKGGVSIDEVIEGIKATAAQIDTTVEITPLDLVESCLEAAAAIADTTETQVDDLLVEAAEDGVKVAKGDLSSLGGIFKIFKAFVQTHKAKKSEAAAAPAADQTQG